MAWRGLRFGLAHGGPLSLFQPLVFSVNLVYATGVEPGVPPRFLESSVLELGPGEQRLVYHPDSWVLGHIV